MNDEQYFFVPDGWAPGVQIAYVPDHAEKDITHPDVEFGFITSVRDEDCSCRYFTKDWKMRTKANSERTPKRNLAIFGHTSYFEVASAWVKWVETSTGDVIPDWLEAAGVNG